MTVDTMCDSNVTEARPCKSPHFTRFNCIQHIKILHSCLLRSSPNCGTRCCSTPITPLNTALFAYNFWRIMAIMAIRQLCIPGGPKSKPPPIFQKIVLKIANKIRFLRKVNVSIKHYNTIRW